MTQDMTVALLAPAAPVPFERFKREVSATWPGPPLCSKAHAWTMGRVLRDLEGLNLADAGEPPRRIASTADLAAPLVMKYALSLPETLSPWTRRGRLCCLRSACRLAEAHRWIALCPFRFIKLPKLIRAPEPSEKRAATREEIRRLFDRMVQDIAEREGWAKWRARRLYAVVALVAYVGLRRNEALKLRVDDLDLAAGLIRLTPQCASKTHAAAQPVPIPPALDPILRDWLDHWMDRPKGYPMPDRCDWLFPTCNRRAPWVSGSPESRAISRLKSVAARVGIHDMNFQMLRRSWATHAEFFGVPPAMIQRVLRHTTPKTTETFYRKADGVNMVESVRDFRF